MKKFCMALSLAGVMAASNLFAAIIGNVTLLDNGYYNNNPNNAYSQGVGGEFRAVGDSGLDSVVNWGAYSSSLTSGTTGSADVGSWGYGSGLAQANQRYFQTFCIEYDEEFTPGNTYSVAISPNAINGGPSSGTASGGPGANSDGTGDPVSIGTAWLYSQFAAGTLSGYCYTYGSGRSTTAGALQDAIWWLEGEAGGSDTGLSGTFLSEAEKALGDTTEAQIEVNEFSVNSKYDVYALNLGAGVQDQLVIAGNTYTGNNASTVPEPTTVFAGALLLLPLGVSAMRILRKSKGH